MRSWILSIALGMAAVMMVATPAQAQRGRYGRCNCCPSRAPYLAGNYGPYPFPRPVLYYPAPRMLPPIYGPVDLGTLSMPPMGQTPELYAYDTQLAAMQVSLRTAADQRSIPQPSLSGIRGNWPIGLQIVSSAETGGPRQQVDDLFDAMTAQKSGGKAVDPQLVSQAKKALDHLQQLVVQSKKEARLPLAVNQESERYLAKLRSGLKKLQQGNERPAMARSDDGSGRRPG